jgi:hypothetical protein
MLAIFKNKKMRPWIIGAVVLVGGGVLFLMLRARGSSDAGSGGAVASGPSEGLQMAQLQAGVASQQASLQASVATAQIMAEAESYRYGQDAQTERAGFEMALAQYQTMAQQAISLAGIDAQKSIALAQEGTAQRGIDVQGQIQQAGIAAQTQIAAYQYDYMKTAAAEETKRTQAMASAQKKSSKNSLLGGIASGIIGLFSDVRAKKNIAWTGESTVKMIGQNRAPESMGRYSWTYRGEFSGYNTGVMAQEALRVIPHAVHMDKTSRLLLVNYGALPG